MTNQTIRQPIPKPERRDPSMEQKSTMPVHRPICGKCGSRDHAEHPKSDSHNA